MFQGSSGNKSISRYFSIKRNRPNFSEIIHMVIRFTKNFQNLCEQAPHGNNQLTRKWYQTVVTGLWFKPLTIVLSLRMKWSWPYSKLLELLRHTRSNWFYYQKTFTLFFVKFSQKTGYIILYFFWMIYFVLLLVFDSKSSNTCQDVEPLFFGNTILENRSKGNGASVKVMSNSSLF